MEAKFRNGAVSLINDILEKAVSLGASDVHIEPLINNTRIRYRVDGLLRNGILVHKSMHQQIISRMKIITDLDISEQRLPQDGRTFMKISGIDFDLRISVVPANLGEKVVVRLLKRNEAALPLEDLGLLKDDLRTYQNEIEKPHGMIIASGPTGSGKTTTLYSSIEKICNESINIITIEDPIEYQLPGINQIQINNKSGLTFAKGLRGILRQDPDVILVGEIRDKETAEIAVSAAMTGHLVFTTLHTNDAASTVIRLIDLGIEPYLISSTVKCVVAQRLVRKLCSSCSGKGCKICNFCGMKGRIGIFELLKINDRIKEVINKKGSSSEIAKASDHKTMFENAKYLIESGITTKEEILKCILVE